jgi:tetratricopeptide (TPR) repeat protein
VGGIITIEREARIAAEECVAGKCAAQPCRFSRVRHGELAAALKDAKYVVKVYEAIVAARPTEEKYEDNLVVAYTELANILMELKDAQSYERAIDTSRKALSLVRALAAAKPGNVKIRRRLAVTNGELGVWLATVGRAREGLPYVEEAALIFASLYEADRASFLAKLDLVDLEESMGNVLAMASEPEKAFAHLQVALDLLGPVPEPPGSKLEIARSITEIRKDMAKAHAAAADLHGQTPQRQAQHWREAHRWAVASLQLARAIVAEKPEVAQELAQFIAEATDVETRTAPLLVSR